MDYYYALLESYDQLKRRKFKLSLREEGDAGDQDPASVIKTLGLGKTKDDPGIQNDVGVYDANAKGKAPESGEDSEAAPDSDPSAAPEKPSAEIFIGMWTKGGQAATLMKDGQVDPSDSKTAQQMIANLMGQEEKDDTTQDDTTKEKKDPVDLKKVEQAKEVKGLVNKVKLTIKNLLGNSASFAGLDMGFKHTRRPESLSNLVGGETQGFSGDLEGLEAQVFNSGKLTDEQKIEALQDLNGAMEALSLLHERGWSEPENVTADAPKGMTEQEAKELGDILGKVKLTPHGVLIGGVAFFYRDNSTKKTDVLRNTVEQLNEAAIAYNSQYDKETVQAMVENDNVDPRIQVLTDAPVAKSGGADESYRGPVAEKFMRMSSIFMKGQRDFSKATTPEERREIIAAMRKKQADVYEDAMNDGSYDKMMEVFGVGRSVALGEILAKGQEDINNATYTTEARRILIEDYNMSEDKAEEMINLAAGADEGQLDKQLAFALLVTSFVNQTFDAELFGDDPDMIPDDVEHMGDTDSTSSGKKADLLFSWDVKSEEECGKIAEYYGKKLGDTAKDSGCDGDGTKDPETGKSPTQEGVGLNNLVKHEDGKCSMEVELKTLTTANSKGGAGELSFSRTQSICDDAPVVEGDVKNPKTGKTMSKYEHDILVNGANPAEGMTQATRDFADENAQRMEACMGVGSQDRACGKHQEISEKMKQYEDFLTPGGGTGITEEDRMGVMDNWWRHKAQNRADQIERNEMARKALQKDPPGAKEQQAVDQFTAYKANPKEWEEKNPNLKAPQEPTEDIKAQAKEYKDNLKQLKKVKEEIHQQVLKRELLRQGADMAWPPNPMADDEGKQESSTISNPEWRDYLAMTYSQATGSTQETLRVSRGVNDGYQSVYLNNATVQGNLAKIKSGAATFEYSDGGGTINIKDKKTGEILASCDTARGVMKWTIGKGKETGARNVISNTSNKKPEAETTDENLMLAFLQGQHALLEKLIG